MDSSTIIALVTALAALIGAASPIVVSLIQSNKDKSGKSNGLYVPSSYVLHRPKTQIRWLLVLSFAFLGGVIGYGGATLAKVNALDSNVSDTPQPVSTSTTQSTLSISSDTPQPTLTPNIQGVLSNLSSDGLIFLLEYGTEKYGLDGYLYPNTCPLTLDDFFKAYEGTEYLYNLKLIEVYSVSNNSCNQTLGWKWTRYGISTYIDATELIASPDSDFRKKIEQQILPTDIKQNLEGMSKNSLIILIKRAHSKFYGQGLHCDSTKESFYAAFPGFEYLVSKNLVSFYTYPPDSSCEKEMLFSYVTDEGTRTINYIMPLILKELSIE